MPVPPRVALITSSYAPHVGGVELVTREVADELRTRGSDPLVVTNRWPRDLPARDVVDGTTVLRSRFRFPEARPRHLAGWLAGSWATRRGLERAVADHGSDLVHVQCVSTNGYYALRLVRRTGLPLVVSLHGELTMDADGIYKRSALLRRTWRHLLTQAAVVTACSAQVLADAVEAYGPELAARSVVVGNGVHFDRVRAAEPVRRDRPYLFAIGRHVPQKGFDLLLDAFAAVASEVPELDLVLAGDGPEHPSLLLRISALGLQRRVELTGVVTPDRAYALFRGATAFVLPSRLEPQGIVLLEAMAAGTPVVAADVGGVAESVSAGTGLLVASGSVDALADGVRTVLAHPDAAGRRAAAASALVAGRTWASVTDRYVNCYSTALNRP